MRRIESFFEKTFTDRSDLFSAEEVMFFAEAYHEHIENGKKKDAAASELFSRFWETYHNLSGKPKTDRDATLKYWNKLNAVEQSMAIDNIPYYLKQVRDMYGTLMYAKKARTYLADKNFNDEFNAIQDKGDENKIMTFAAKDINELR